MNDLELASGRDHVWAQAVDGTPDLVHLRPAIRTFLTEIDEQLTVDVVLMAVLLGADAFRYGRPPVTMRVALPPGGQCVRLEVDDHRRYSPHVRPFGYRERLLSQSAHQCGLGQSEQGGTRAWAEISVRTAVAARIS